MDEQKAKIAKDKVSIATWRLSTRFPYLRRLLSVLDIKPTDIEGLVLAIDDELRLYTGKMLFNLAPEEVAGVLLHEIHHVLRNHFERLPYDQFPEEQRLLVNAAMDLEINNELVNSNALDNNNVKLPDGALMPEQFNLKDGQPAEKYLQQLLKRFQQQQPSMPGNDGDGGDEQETGGDQGFQQQQKKGDGSQDTKFKHPHGGCLATSKGGNQGSDNQEQDNRNSPGGSGDSERQEHIERILKQAAEDIIEATDKGGYRPYGVSERLYQLAKERLNTSSVDWQQVLGMLVRDALYRASDEAEDFTYQRRSRRQLEISDVVLPGTYKPVPELWVVADVSGSMNFELLAMAYAEVRHILQRLAMPQFIGVAWSTQLENQRVIRNVNDVNMLFTHVGGGTDMQAGIRYAIEHGAQVVVVLTDGDTSWFDLEHTCKVPTIIGLLPTDDRYYGGEGEWVYNNQTRKRELVRAMRANRNVKVVFLVRKGRSQPRLLSEEGN
jgi:predicted metal-dependent peptidase